MERSTSIANGISPREIQPMSNQPIRFSPRGSLKNGTDRPIDSFEECLGSFVAAAQGILKDWVDQ